MSDQKIYQKILRKVIDQTNNDQIDSSEQLMKILVNELTNQDGLLKPYIQAKDKMYG